MTDTNRSIVSRMAVPVVLAGAVVVLTVALLKMDFPQDEEVAPAAQSSVPAELLKWELVTAFDSEFQTPRAVACGAGRIVVIGDSDVRVFDEKTNLIKSWSLSKEPSAVDVDAAGKIYVATGDAVAIFTMDGEKRASWSVEGESAYITSIKVSGEAIYFADSMSRTVRRADLSGKVNLTIDGMREGNVLGFVIRSPYFDLDIAPGGNAIRIVNPGLWWIEAYTLDGEFQYAWGKGGRSLSAFTGCCNPCSITFLADGRLVTAEKTDADAKVKVFEKDDSSWHDGILESVVLRREDVRRPKFGLDVAIDSQQRIVALELGPRGRVMISKRVTGRNAESDND